MFRLLEAPHVLPKRVLCWVYPTRKHFGGAAKVEGPSRVEVEKDLEMGEKTEYVRVRGNVWRSAACEVARSIECVVGVAICGAESLIEARRAEMDVGVMKSGRADRGAA